jgi:hypothetical protein
LRTRICGYVIPGQHLSRRFQQHPKDRDRGQSTNLDRLADSRYSLNVVASRGLCVRYRRTCWLTFAALRIASLSAIQLCLATVRSKSKFAKATFRTSEPGKESSSLTDNPAAASPPSRSRHASFSS